jgi:hypothetical protein
MDTSKNTESYWTHSSISMAMIGLPLTRRGEMGNFEVPLG